MDGASVGTTDPASAATPFAGLVDAARFAVPSPGPGHVRRPRLLHLLDEPAPFPLVLVSAPAGTGKSTLVAEWARERVPPADLGWVTFEAGEEPPDDLGWRRVVDCLGRKGVDTSGTTWSGVAPDADGIAALADALAGRRRRLVLVLDGYDFASAVEATALEGLLRLAGGALLAVVVGRVDPALPLYRYRLDGGLLELRAADLAFTDAEASAMVAACGLQLAPDRLHDLNHRVGGWAAGLRFAVRGLAAYDDPGAAVAEILVDGGDIGEYLVGEVLDVQPPGLRHFLLATSVPDLLLPGLLEELGGPVAMRTVQQLTHGNAFVDAVPEAPGCYRYASFFRDVLRAQLDYELPDEARALQRRAARWYVGQGMPDTAVAHFVAAGDWTEAATAVVQGLGVARLMLDRGGSRITRSLRQLPADVAGPDAALVRAAVAAASGDGLRCERELADVPGDATTPERAASRAVVAAAAARSTAEPDAAAALAAQARTAVAALRVGRLLEMRVAADLCCAVADLRRGELQSTRHACLVAAQTATDLGSGVLAVEPLAVLALVDAVEGHLGRAERGAHRALEHAESLGWGPELLPPAAHTALALVDLGRDDLDRLRDRLRQLRAARLVAADPVTRTLLAVAAAAAMRARGNLARAEAVLAEAGATLARGDCWLADQVVLERARLHLDSRRPDEALSSLGAAHEAASPEVLLLAARARLDSGDDAEAERLLQQAQHTCPSSGARRVDLLLVRAQRELHRPALVRASHDVERASSLATADTLRRPFYEVAEALRPLVLASPSLAGQLGWLAGPTSQRRAVLALPEPRRPAEAPPVDVESALVVEELTPKEREVLGHLEALLTTQEIADKMFVSVNTVRTHIRNILRKLGVSRRNAAVRRARELGLLEPLSISPSSSSDEAAVGHRRCDGRHLTSG